MLTRWWTGSLTCEFEEQASWEVNTRYMLARPAAAEPWTVEEKEGPVFL